MSVANRSDGDFGGRVAVIAGASRGIGADTARAWARAGAVVVLAGRDENALRATADDIVGLGGRALAVPTDVTDEASVRRLVERAVDTYGRLDYGFNNATAGRARLRWPTSTLASSTWASPPTCEARSSG